MTEIEGVIKFRLKHRFGDPVAPEAIKELNAWRSVLHRLGLIGQDPVRYGGLGFGNVSRRLQSEGALAFVISGTQTGAREHLAPDDYTIVVEASPGENRIVSQGPVRPSSEALTHAAVYAANSDVGSVIHVHSPEIWRSAAPWSLPATAANIAYGTPAMAAAVSDLFASGRLDSEAVFAMLGHEDGIVAFGAEPESAAQAIIRLLARSFGL